MRRIPEKMGAPTPTIGDGLPYCSCYYQNVPKEYKLNNLIKPFSKYPLTAAVLPDLIETADMEFFGWEIMGESFEDFGNLVKLQYKKGAASLERYISSMKDFKVALTSITKATIGAGKTVTTNDSTNTSEGSNKQTLDTEDAIKGTDTNTGKVILSTENTTRTDNKNEGENSSGPVGFGKGGDQDFTTTDRNESMNKTVGSVTSKGTNTTDNNTTAKHDNTTTHTGTVDHETHDKTHSQGTNTTLTDEHITETETITPGVAIAEIQKIAGIDGVEQYFIDLLKPCFTLYRWYNW